MLNGTFNLTGSNNGASFVQWISYRDWNPLQIYNGTYGVEVRATAPTIPPNNYFWAVPTFTLLYQTAGNGAPVGGVPNPSYACPQAAVFLSCVDSSLGQQVVQPNFCAATSSPPTGYNTCILPPVDGANFLIGYANAHSNMTAITGNTNLNFNFANQLAPGPAGTFGKMVDFTGYTNCSLVFQVYDECNNRVTANQYLTGIVAMQLQTAAPQPVNTV
jgi:hypothetical protein